MADERRYGWMRATILVACLIGTTGCGMPRPSGASRGPLPRNVGAVPAGSFQSQTGAGLSYGDGMVFDEFGAASPAPAPTPAASSGLSYGDGMVFDEFGAGSPAPAASSGLSYGDGMVFDQFGAGSPVPTASSGLSYGDGMVFDEFGAGSPLGAGTQVDGGLPVDSSIEAGNTSPPWT
jgi:hypothetical protein